MGIEFGTEVQTVVNIWLLIGGRNTHKTSTVRALTGVGSKSPAWLMAYGARGTLNTYVHPAGLQEMKVPPERFIDDVEASGSCCAIAALRYEGARECPDAEAYLEKFRKAKWNIAGYAVLERSPLFRGFPGGIVIPDAKDTPSNEIANQLRRRWRII